MIILVHGSPSDGFEFIGPFDDREQATEYAMDSTEGEWWVCELQSPLEHAVREKLRT